MDSNNQHERLLAELIESYGKLRAELKRFDEIGEEIIRASIALPSSNDTILDYTRQVKSEYLETELKNKKNELAKQCQPYRVCVDVFGVQSNSHDETNKYMTISVMYGNNKSYAYDFKNGNLNQVCVGSDEMFKDNMKRSMDLPRAIFHIMTREELASHGFIVGKPPLNKQIK